MDFLRKFNLFPSIPPSTNELDLRNQRISTRLFIISLIFAIAILIGYSSLVNITKVNVINAPTFTQYSYLYSKYSQALTCPCTQVSIRYDKFLQINYTLHQVCNSTFVSNNWIAYLVPIILDENAFKNDFRTLGTYMFQALKALCESSDRTITDDLSRFYLNEYSTLSITPKELFESQSQTLMKQFISSTLNDFLSLLQIIRDITYVNTLFSALQTNFGFEIPDHDEASIGVIDWSNCTCDSSVKCIQSLIIYNDTDYDYYNDYDSLFIVTGLYVGCFVVEALLQSTLECFYDQTCINTLQSYITASSPMNVSSLDPLLSSQYHKNSTIQTLVDQLMVEKWNLSSVYENYYNECQPIKCTYTSLAKNGAVYIITTIFGLIGGFVRVLRFIIPGLVNLIPRLIKIIRRRLRFSRIQTEITLQQPYRQRFAKLKDYLLTMNLFPSIPPSINEFDLRNQRISTRLFIISLIFAIAILIGYSSLINITRINVVNAPTFIQYSYLYSKYSQALTCPCTKVSIRYDKFLQINYTLHQVCNSTFVSNDWIAYLAPSNLGQNYYLEDFRMTGKYMFQALKTFCEASDRTITDDLSQFYSNEHATLSITPEELFESQSQALMKQFISSTLNDFLFSLQIIHDTTQANSLYSALGKQYRFGQEFGTQIVVRYLEPYDDCYCSAENCVINASIFDYNTTDSLFDVPGLYSGCFVVESLLQSTLECFYDQTCINTLQSYLTALSPVNVSSLDPLLSSQYHKNSTIQTIVDQLMVEKWNLSSVYENYYNECQPIKCTYTSLAKNGAVYIITTIFGLIGGLVTVLRVLIPQLVSLIPQLIKIIRKRLRFSRAETVDHTNEHSGNFWQRLLRYLRNFNLFPLLSSSTNEFNLRNQLISTRLFIISLILSVTILVVYSSLVNVTVTVAINVPNLTEYSYWYSKHSDTLVCPCTKISINYEKFLVINYTLHQVCKSTFVADNYVKSFLVSDAHVITQYPDFQDIFPYTLNALASFCQLMEKIISDSLTQFYSNQYISATVTPEQLFELQAHNSFQQFVSLQINELLLSMRMVRDTTQANGLLSGLSTNYYLELLSLPDYPDIEFLQPVATEPSNCSCVNSVSCTMPAIIYITAFGNNNRFVIPGLYWGCFVIEALLQSTLECFYNQTCIHMLEWYLPSSSSSLIHITPLNSSLISRYNVHSTIQELVNQLMVENWNLSVIYKNYYDECQSMQCTYTYTKRIDAVFIATTIFSVIGGLVTVLKFIIPRLVRLIAYGVHKRRARVNPELAIVRS